MGWGAAMLIMGIGLDYSDTFRNHPCPTKNTTEKNYTLCFIACTIFALAAMAVSTQFRFQAQGQHRPDEVGGLVMDTRIDEVDPAIAQKTRAKQLQVVGECVIRMQLDFLGKHAVRRGAMEECVEGNDECALHALSPWSGLRRLRCRQHLCFPVLAPAGTFLGHPPAESLTSPPHYVCQHRQA